jgi:hypothetical protein
MLQLGQILNVTNLFYAAGEQVTEDQNFVTSREQRFCKVRADKSRPVVKTRV